MLYLHNANFIDGRSGKITLASSVFTAATGWANCKTGESAFGPTYWRAYFAFDTSAVPAEAEITSVSFLVVKRRSQPYGDPQYYVCKFSIGEFIGTTLDGDAGEWNGGTLAATIYAKPTGGQLISLGSVGIAAIVPGGQTDVRVWDDSTQGTGDFSWGVDFNQTFSKCQLRIVYSMPSAELVGQGLTEAAGNLEAAGSATITGEGVCSCAANVEAVGAATATGEGVLDGGGLVERLGAATAIGEGILEGGAVLEIVGVATLIAEGLLAVAGVIYIPPWAQHSATRSVAASHVASRAVAVDVRTIDCSELTEGTRNARRLTG